VPSLPCRRPDRSAPPAGEEPRFRPRVLLERGDDEVMYVGHLPMGLLVDRSFRELPNVPLEDEV
jgi:hypothetical protein